MTYEEFETEILHLTGINLVLYKEKQMKRRLDTLIKNLGLDGYDSYLKTLQQHPTKKDAGKHSLEYFLQYITINVTEFFRTPEHWNYVADNVLSQLPDDAIIWSCACSTGEEAYSLAISIAEQRPLGNVRIIATDIDAKALDTARKGEYTLHNMGNVSEDILVKYFTPIAKGYKISDEIRNHVEFWKLNLLADAFPQNCDLITCRNVLIYFTDEAKDKLYRSFNKSLRPGGHLFTGQTEQILLYKVYGFQKERGFLFKKKTLR